MTIDPSTRERWRREVAREFVEPRAVGGWRAWHDAWAASTAPLTELLLAAADLRPGLRVLDVGSGTGEPALTIAGRVGPTGAVVASDLSPQLLATAEERAARAGLANLTCRRADVAALPFPDGAFDRATCRLGAMYFLDPVADLAEIRRVLRPGGRAAALVWGDPTHISYAAEFFGPILSRTTLPAPEPGAPNPYRFAPAGALGRALTAAGFRAVEERTERVAMRFPGTADDYMRWFRDVAIPMDFIWEAIGPAETERAIAEIVAGMRRYEDGDAVRLEVEVVVAAGTR